MLIDNAVNIALALLPVNQKFDEYQPLARKNRMSIRIEITDPLMTAAHELLAVADLLTALANKTRIVVPDATPNGARDLQARPSTVGKNRREAVEDAGAAIAPEDSPAAGVNPAEVFAHGSAELDADAAKLNAMYGAGTAGPTAAEVFGGNAAGGVSVGSLATSGQTSASIPPAPPSAPSAAAATADLDAAGLPWDARIHSSSKEKNKTDGKWRARRGVDAAEVARVEAELRAVMGNGVPAPALPNSAAGAPPAVNAESQSVALAPNPSAASVPPPPLPSNAGNLPPPPPPPPANGAQAATVAPPPAPATASATTVTDAPAQISFPQLCGKITSAIGNGSLTHARLAEVLAAHKLQGLPTLAAFPHLVGLVANDLGFA